MLNYECKVENKSDIRRELTISVKPDSIANFLLNQLKEMQKTAKIKGFRPGKVPMDIVKRYYLDDAKSKVFSKVIQESYLRALEDNKITAVGMPHIEPKSGSDLRDGESLTFTALVEIFPDIKVGELSKIKVDRPSTEVSDEDVDTSIANLRDSNAEMILDEANEGPAKSGDYVSISFRGKIDGKEVETLKGDNRLVQLGANQYMVEFENEIVGMKKGDTRTFNFNFKKDFSDEKLAGKTAEFTVTVHEFKKKQLPELDDEFAKRFKLENRLELRKKVFDTLKEDREKESREKLKEALLHELVSAHPFEVPEALVGSQFEHLLRENAQYLQGHGFTEKMIRDYFDKNKEQLKKRAEEQVRASLILDRIADEQGIRIEDADLDHEYAKISERINVPVDEVRKLYANDENALRQLRYRMKEERTVEYVLGHARVTDVKPGKNKAK